MTRKRQNKNAHQNFSKEKYLVTFVHLTFWQVANLLNIKYSSLLVCLESTSNIANYILISRLESLNFSYA